MDTYNAKRSAADLRENAAVVDERAFAVLQRLVLLDGLADVLDGAV
jgi:hypothetical protein